MPTNCKHCVSLYLKSSLQHISKFSCLFYVCILHTHLYVYGIHFITIACNLRNRIDPGVLWAYLSDIQKHPYPLARFSFVCDMSASSDLNTYMNKYM